MLPYESYVLHIFLNIGICYIYKIFVNEQRIKQKYQLYHFNFIIQKQGIGLSDKKYTNKNEIVKHVSHGC